nr:hypothetical protein [Bacillus thuringiensis]
MLTLLWAAISELSLEDRTKPIHILTYEVGGETPVMTAYISRTLKKTAMYSCSGSSDQNKKHS